MTAKEDLFELIKSLSKTEKAYFKKYASLHSNEGKQQYLTLFEILNEMESYDENILKHKIAHLGIKQLPVYKNYLYKIILRSQVQYTRTHSENHYLEELLLEIEVLMAKNLFGQCLSLISKAKNIAQENENFPSFLKVIQYEVRYIKQSPSVKNWHEVYESASRQEAEILKKLHDIATTRDLNAEMFLFLQRHALQKEEVNVQRELQHLYQKLMAYSQENYSSAECAINHLSAFVNYYKFMQAPEKAAPYQFQAIELFEKKPFLILNDPLRYVNSLSNLLILQMMQGDKKAFMLSLKKLKSVENLVPKNLLSPNLQLHIFTLSLRHELSFYVKFEQYEFALKVMEQNKASLLKQSTLMNEIFLFQIIYYYACVYFYLKQSQSANYWLQRILQSPINSYNKKWYFSAKMLHFLIYWQDENWDFVKSLEKSIVNFVKKHQIEATFEKEFMIKLIALKYVQKQKNQAHFVSLQVEMDTFLQGNKPVENDFDYAAWWEKEQGT